MLKFLSRLALLLGASLAPPAVAQPAGAPQSGAPQSGDQLGAASSADRVDATRRRVAELIKQLAAPEYIARRSAEIELGEIGLPAFDQVLAASRSPDPEVSAACAYLLSGLAIEWAEPDDPASVRRWLKEYGSLDDEDRRAVVDQIKLRWRAGELAVAEGLCRIARFDPSPAVASRAAATLIDSDQLAVAVERAAAIRGGQKRLDRRHGPSSRPSQRWLDRFAAQGETEGPAAADALARWEEATDRFVDENAGAGADPTALSAIAWNRLRLQLTAGQGDAAATVDRLVALATQQLGAAATDRALRRVFEWLIESGADEAIDAVAEQQRDELATKGGRYLLASVRHRQGRTEQADKLAAEARATPEAQGVAAGGVVLDGRIEVALRLRAEGHDAWAHGEYRDVIGDGPPLTASVVVAQQRLADSLQDAAQHAEAADTLAELVAQINADARTKRAYEQLVESGRVRLSPMRVVEARRHYNRALAHRAAGEEAACRQSLAHAIQSDRSDADVLIAMYRSRGAEPAYRREVLRRVRELAEDFERRIEENPGADGPLNQWAWLIGNTEGDYQQAIEYSERSLRIAPGDAGYLDTLARCYFAAGRLEDAVRTQRQAVAKLPSMRVMQRQLAEFEAAAELEKNQNDQQ